MVVVVVVMMIMVVVVVVAVVMVALPLRQESVRGMSRGMARERGGV